MSQVEPASDADIRTGSRQLGRPLRGVAAVAHRCACGNPDVVMTYPTLPDGTPFPTLYYLTCPRASGQVGTLEAESVMRLMSSDLATDTVLQASYRSAHEAYLADRAALGEPPAIAGISAGGMPERVKCLHVLVAHSLARGPGVNPLGDRALAMLAERGATPDNAWGGSAQGCVTAATTPADAASTQADDAASTQADDAASTQADEATLTQAVEAATTPAP